MRLKLSNLPDDFIKEYSLAKKVTKYGYVYAEICRGMYGKPQSGLLDQQLIINTFEQRRFLSERTHSRFLDTRVAANIFHLMC